MANEVPPVPVTLAVDIDTGQDARWRALNNEIRGHPDFTPLTIKAAYVFGVIHDFCESVDWLLKHERAWPVTYLSAFGLCASGIELLGRCLRGNTGTRGCVQDLREGLEWLKSSSPKAEAPQSAVTVTSYTQYDVDLLETLRHFTLHGQATKKPQPQLELDIELLDAFPWLIGNAMERYWDKLLNSTVYCERLAKANVIPLRSEPIRKIWEFFSKKGTSAGTPFYQFNWRVCQAQASDMHG
jgi:hypothetical protein